MRLILLASIALAACSDGIFGVGTNVIGATELVLEAPGDGAEVYTLEPMAIRAKASNTNGIRRLVLRVAGRDVKTCTGGDGPAHEHVACEHSVDVRDFAALQADGTLEVAALAQDGDDEEVKATATVKLTPVRVKFVKPEPAEGGRAEVSGSSLLRLVAEGELPVQQVAVTFDDGVPLQLFESAPFESTIDWKAFVGAGDHTLTATATDSRGRTASARLQIRVAP